MVYFYMQIQIKSQNKIAKLACISDRKFEFSGKMPSKTQAVNVTADKFDKFEPHHIRFVVSPSSSYISTSKHMDYPQV